MTTISVCATCRTESRDTKAGTPEGAVFLAHVSAAAEAHPGLSVREVSCLMGCDHGCNAAISADGKMTYVLGRFTGCAEDAEALAEYAAGHAASESGAVPFRQWPQGVKGHFIARVPPLK